MHAVCDPCGRSGFSIVRSSSSFLYLFQRRLRMDRIEKVIYVDTLQSQSAVQHMFAPYGEM